MKLSYYSDYYVATKEAIPPRGCRCCGTVFNPSAIEAETCSIECREKFHTSRLPSRECAASQAERLQSKEVGARLGVHEHTIGKWRGSMI